MTITRMLVANRGEIARRVMRTCRELGIGTVAVHSDADAALAFVEEADVAVRLPGDAPADTYLRADLLVEAARRTGADAVHPGYGFLSESPDFARAVQDAGLVWVGPTPTSMEQMATKVEAKKLMEAAGVPVLPELAPAEVTAADLPVLVKASAGGGGRGMRVVRTLEELAATVEQASGEAASAFGDPTVFVEPYVERGRHVEVQVVGDTHGTVLVLGERDCSLQRRHQKVVEETPAPGLPDGLRRALHDAARTAAAAIGYVGAGTVEFLVAAGPGADDGPPTGTPDRFFFLEMNTRLQVEHPVTECVTGLDLVALQIAVAEGERLPEAPEPRGHAIEVRLYAEDPAAGWQPQSGRLTRFEVPHVAAELACPPAHGLRLDSGFRSGDEVGTHYDAMLAKVVAWAPTRAEAARRLAAALRRTRIHGVRTNRDLLAEVLTHPAFVAGRVSTAFLAEERLRSLTGGTAVDADETRLAVFAAGVACAEEAARSRPVQAGIPAGWRNVVSAPHRTVFDRDGADVVAAWHGGRDGFRSADVPGARAARPRCIDGGWRVTVDHAGTARWFDVAVAGDRVDVDSADGHLALRRRPRFTDPALQVAEGSLLAPMPGSVVALHVAPGEPVAAGQPVLVLEAMKMQHTVAAPHDGVLAEVAVAVGDQVTAGAVLAVVHGPAGDGDGHEAAGEQHDPHHPDDAGAPA